ILTWTPGSGSTSSDVYFGTSSTPPFVTNTTGGSFNPGGLLSGTKYYWRIVAKNSAGSTSSSTVSFTTQGVAAYGISGQVTFGAGALSGVTMTLSGSLSTSTSTDSSGNYSFAGLTPGGNYTVTPSRAGYSFTPASQSFNNLSGNQTAGF